MFKFIFIYQVFLILGMVLFPNYQYGAVCKPVGIYAAYEDIKVVEKKPLDDFGDIIFPIIMYIYSGFLLFGVIFPFLKLFGVVSISWFSAFLPLIIAVAIPVLLFTFLMIMYIFFRKEAPDY